MYRSPVIFDWQKLFDEVKVRGRFDSDAQLAESLGLTRAQISAWRTGKSALGTLIRLKLLDALGYDSLHAALHSLYPTDDREALAERQARLVQRVGGIAQPQGDAGRRVGDCSQSAPWCNNDLLMALSDADRSWLGGHCTDMSLSTGQLLYSADEGSADLYFPTTAVIAVVLEVGAGCVAEVAVIGREGVIGKNLFFSNAIVAAHATVQCEGCALRLAAPVFHEALARSAVFRHRFFGYAEMFARLLA